MREMYLVELSTRNMDSADGSSAAVNYIALELDRGLETKQFIASTLKYLDLRLPHFRLECETNELNLPGYLRHEVHLTFGQEKRDNLYCCARFIPSHSSKYFPSKITGMTILHEWAGNSESATSPSFNDYSALRAVVSEAGAATNRIISEQEIQKLPFNLDEHGSILDYLLKLPSDFAFAKHRSGGASLELALTDTEQSGIPAFALPAPKTLSLLFEG